MTFVLGIDGGTESIRAHLFDLKGCSHGSFAAAYTTRFGTNGEVEQNPDDWWTALGEAVRGAVSTSGVDPAQISALAADTTSCTVVALDEHGGPLRPGLLWMDVRAADEAEDVLATGDRALRVNGGGHGPVSAEWMIPKALWLKRHEPETFKNAHVIAEYQDYLMLRLTGRLVGSLTNAGIRWHHDNASFGWPDTLLNSLDLSELRRKWPSTLLAPGELVGTLTKQAADHLGLPRSVKVAQGGADAFMAMIGLHADRQGKLALITGSSHLQLTVSEHTNSSPGLWGSYADIVFPGLKVIEGGQTSSGSTVAWLWRIFGTDIADRDALNRQATDINPGSDGIVMLDHFLGNRTPFTDAHSRGAIVGLTLGHERAHLFRAAIEAICFGTRATVEHIKSAGIDINEIAVSGGAVKSALWLQTHADTIGAPVKVPRFPDAPVLGSAILAAVGAGHFDTISEGMHAMVAFDHTVDPIPKNQTAYDEIYASYSALYPALKQWRENRGSPSAG